MANTNGQQTHTTVFISLVKEEIYILKGIFLSYLAEITITANNKNSIVRGVGDNSTFASGTKNW